MNKGGKSFALFILIILMTGSMLGCLGDDGDSTDDGNDSLASPELLLPNDLDLIEVTHPYFEWTSVTDAEEYEIRIDNDSSFSSPVVNTTVSTDHYDCLYPLSDGTYYWMVRVREGDVWSNWSSVWSFTVSTGGGDETVYPPILLSPTNEAELTNPTPFFEWTSVADPEEYEIKIDNDSSFSSPVVNTTVSTCHYDCNYSLSDDTYYWMVRARQGDVWSNWSLAWNFTISTGGGDETIDPPILLSPTNEAELTNPTPLFEWMNVMDAEEYEIQVDNNSSFASPVFNTTVSSTHCICSEPLSYDTYYWRVRSWDGDVWSNWSSTWNFTITPQVKSGILTEDETWSGEIFVDSYLEVPRNVTLTIDPGTIIRVKACKDYQDLNGKIGIHIRGGTLNAMGSAEEQIVFTSGSEDPINGDWSGVWFHDSFGSTIDYVVVEFCLLGIGQFDSSVNISHSIVRWVNWEGIYAERSTFSVENCTLYSNGYHEIALEQYNQDVVIRNNIFRDGNFGVHSEKTDVLIEGNYFHDYSHIAITAGHQSNLTVINNKFENITDKEIGVNPDCTLVESGNDMGGGSVPIPEMDYEVIEWRTLGYIPCDRNDRYAYVFDPEDETRRVVERMGQGLSFGWTLLYADNYLWRFTFGGATHDFVKINPADGTYQKFDSPMMNPRGIAWDGEYFWVNDFSLLKIFKFKVNENSVVIHDSFDIPEKEKGGCMGLTFDGTFLYLIKRDGSGVYKIATNGTLMGSITFSTPIHHAIVWTGEYFWAVGGDRGIGKFTSDGNLVGSIYRVAEGTWGLAWDGEHLWTLQRTCELWDDDKIFRIEVLDCSLSHEAVCYSHHRDVKSIIPTASTNGSMELYPLN